MSTDAGMSASVSESESVSDLVSVLSKRENSVRGSKASELKSEIEESDLASDAAE